MTNSPHKIKTVLPGILPSWQTNLLLFGLLTILTFAAFFWQLAKINTSFREHSLEHSRMVAGVIQQNLQNAILSQQTISEIIGTFLGNSARFVAYLEQIEPFNSEELASFALKAGLAGITIHHNSGKIVSGPAGWFTLPVAESRADGTIHHSKDRQIIYMTLPLDSGKNQQGYIIVGFNAHHIEILQKKTGLKALLTAVSSLPGINYVRLIPKDDRLNNEQVSVKLIDNDGQLTAETILSQDIGRLIVGLDAKQYILRVSFLRRQFVMFGCLLALLGLFFSWLLYYMQKADIARARNFERVMARQHEAAALGRATATIAHEIRNPLNAIYMGLQRLTMESENLDHEQHELLSAMGKAVKRTSKIVNELQRFTKPVTPNLQPVNLAQLIEEIIALYQPMIRNQQIKIIKEINFKDEIKADPELLAEMFDNLLKNAIEAQPKTGFINLSLDCRKKQVVLTIINGGCDIEPEEINRLAEPYFTTKTRGSGLGLVVSRRIIEAHGGKFEINADKNKSLRVTVSLPGVKQ
jgi:signal transduction histidine kinase